MATNTASLLLTLALGCFSTSSIVTSEKCNCFLNTERNVNMSQCIQKKPDFRFHNEMDIGLVGSCLPFIISCPSICSKMECFKWRTANLCPGNKDGLEFRCVLRRRIMDKDEDTIIPDNVQDYALMRSPGYSKKKPSYYNYNFCIYNISLSCSHGQRVEVAARGSSQLADNVDYLWLSERPLDYITSDRIANYREEIDAHSFLVVLWSNQETSRGHFEIDAQCLGEPSEVEPSQDTGLNLAAGSGENLLL